MKINQQLLIFFRATIFFENGKIAENTLSDDQKWMIFPGATINM